jgi:hypothetical protein
VKEWSLAVVLRVQHRHAARRQTLPLARSAWPPPSPLPSVSPAKELSGRRGAGIRRGREGSTPSFATLPQSASVCCLSSVQWSPASSALAAARPRTR